MIENRDYYLDSDESLEGDTTMLPISISDASEQYPEVAIKIDRDQYSIFELKRRYDLGRIQIDPEFQRNSVWTMKQKSELIESVIMGIPLPLIYLAENPDGRLVVVDGRQRLSTFFAYLDGEFPLSELKILPYISKCRIKDLELDFPKYHTALEDFQLVVQIIKHPTPDRVRFDIFDRVNRGGTPLNNQEMRNALYQGNAIVLLKELAQNERFLEATDYSVNTKRMKDRYIILRALIFSLWRKNKLTDIKGNLVEYKSDIEEFLGMGMEYLNRLTDPELQQIKATFEGAMNIACQVYGSNIFRIPSTGEKRRPVSMTLFESLYYLFTLFQEKEGCFDPQAVAESLDAMMFQDEEYMESLTYNVDSAVHVEDRFRVVEEIYEEVMDVK